jgi:maltose O-acetyltransferase
MQIEKNMDISAFASGIILKFAYLILVKPKIIFFKIASTCKVEGNPYIDIPTIFLGKGSIRIKTSATIGIRSAPGIFNAYNHIEARDTGSSILIDNGTILGNNLVIIAETTHIKIGKNVLIGQNVTITDSDFHSTEPIRRAKGDSGRQLRVEIGNNAWIGSGATILKGVRIGENSVVGANSVVTKNVEENIVVAGTPAKLIRRV